MVLIFNFFLHILEKYLHIQNFLPKIIGIHLNTLDTHWAHPRFYGQVFLYNFIPFTIYLVRPSAKLF
jgi:hypothetical protein